MSDGRILIVGGGIAGLTLATALHRRGLTAEIIERGAAWAPVGAGIAVQPNGMRVLRELGLGAAVESRGALIRRWLLREMHGEVLCAIDLEAFWGRVGPFVGIARGALHEVLLAGTASEKYRLDTTLTWMRQDNDCVAVGFDDGSMGEYRVVIGADGVGSTVRRFALNTPSPIYGDQMVWRALARFSPREPDAVQFWLGEGCFFGLVPMGAGLTYGFANVTTPRLHDPVEGRLTRLRTRFAGFGEQIHDFLASLEGDTCIHCAPIEWLEAADRWHAGHVVLAGDAAHACSPMMGQGGCMAMEDALVLAEALHVSPNGVEDGLETYVRRRLPRVNLVRRGSRAIGEMLGLLPGVRAAILREWGEQAFQERFSPLAERP